MKQLFSLRSLHLLGNGELEQDFEAILASLVKDCLARPGLDKVREVKIVVQVRPVQAKDGTCDDVTVDVQVASKSPARCAPTYIMRATVNGGLRYSPDSPANPDQPGLGLED